jgi:hypothetical protein
LFPVRIMGLETLSKHTIHFPIYTADPIKGWISRRRINVRSRPKQPKWSAHTACRCPEAELSCAAVAVCVVRNDRQSPGFTYILVLRVHCMTPANQDTTPKHVSTASPVGRSHTPYRISASSRIILSGSRKTFLFLFIREGIKEMRDGQIDTVLSFVPK